MKSMRFHAAIGVALTIAGCSNKAPASPPQNSQLREAPPAPLPPRAPKGPSVARVPTEAEIARAAPLDKAERFTFESGSEAAKAPLTQREGLALLFGTTTPKFPADQPLGRFRLGMAIEDVYREAGHGAYQVMPLGGIGDQKCPLASTNGSSPTFVYIPAFIHIEASDGAYQLGFERFGGDLVVSSIDWHPAKKAMSDKLSDYYTPIELRDKLMPSLGRPNFQLTGQALKEADQNDTTMRWCTAGDKSCLIEDQMRDTDYPAISIEPAGVYDASAVLLDGTLDRHGQRRESSQNLSRTGGDTRPGCIAVTDAETRLFSGYVMSTNNDELSFDGQTILRQTALPPSIQSQITAADGVLDYAKTEAGRLILFFTVYVPNAEINVRDNVMVFSPVSPGVYHLDYRGDWRDLKIHIRDHELLF